MFVLLVIDPDVPYRMIVEVPVGARREALNVIVTFELLFAGTLTGLAVAVADTPLGNAFTLSSTEEWKPSTLVIVSVSDAFPPSSTVNDEGETDKVKFGDVAAAFTVSAIVVLWLVDPDVPVIVTVAAPVVAVEDAVSVRVEVALPFAAGVTGLVENDAVTPLGKPLALSVVAELNPPVLVMVIVLVALEPWVTVTDVGDAAMVKLGDAAALTVSAMVVVAVKVLEVPVMVTVADPVVAVLLAVSVRTLVPVVGLVPNDAVTPLGRPDAASVTLPENPPAPVTVIVLVPLLPCVTDKLLGEAESVKLGEVEVGARRLIRPFVFGLPQPVHRS